MISEIIYIIAAVVSLIIIIRALSFVQSIAAVSSLEGIYLQPYSADIVKKNYFLITALLELPLILSFLSLGYIYTLCKYNIWGLAIIMFILCCGVIIISSKIIKSCEKIMYSFLLTIAHHPLGVRSLFNKFIILLTMIQAPLLLFLIAIIVNSSYIIASISYTELLFDSEAIIIAGLMIMCIGLAYGVLIGIEKAGYSLWKNSFYAPSFCGRVYSSFIISMGLIELPLFLGLIINVFVLQSLVNDIDKGYAIVIFCASLFFAALSYLVTTYSGKMIGYALSKGSNDSEREKKIISVALWAQFFIDARILYMFIIVIIIIVKIL